jgi:hypothetical protein
VDELSPVSQLLKKARRRSILDLVLDQSALAISIAMGGAIVLMLTGTSLLEWYWIALLAAASLAIGLYRLRGRVPSQYRLAQRIDWKMNLADALSTATYFADVRDGSPRREEICAQQRHSAEEIARTIDPRVAVPFTRSRFAWPAAGLLLVACGLFAVRYAVTGTMSLEPSLVKMAYDTFFGNSPQQKAKNTIRKNPIDPNSPLDPGNPDAPTTQNDQVPDSQMESVETPDVNNSAAADQSKEAAKGQKTSPEDSQGDNGEKGEKGEQSAKQDDGNQDKKDGAKSDKSKEGKPDAKNQNASNENSSMLDKLKDAMANMMNKMKSSPPKESQSAQNSQDSKSGGQEKGQKSSQNQKGSQSDSQDADAQSDQQQQQGDKSEQKQSANAKSGDKSQDKNNSPDAKSGIGSSDGDKAAKEAEQLAAMGKISEILGKRAANVTGEVMVEVGSTKQQLKTPWAQKQATHIEAGSEIHRDEVPLMYQQFVQQYFEEIRKGADAGAKPGTPKSTDSKSTQKTPSP